MKGYIVTSAVFAAFLLLMVPAIPAVEWNECNETIKRTMGSSPMEQLEKIAESDDYPLLVKILVRILLSIVSSILGRIAKQKPVLGLMLQLMWFLIVRLIITPTGITS